jgi:hypothetical protein
VFAVEGFVRNNPHVEPPTSQQRALLLPKEVVRLTKLLSIFEVHEGYWVARCHACRKGCGRIPLDERGKFTGASHNHAEQWWHRHRLTPSHIRSVNFRPTAEDIAQWDAVNRAFDDDMPYPKNWHMPFTA